MDTTEYSMVIVILKSAKIVERSIKDVLENELINIVMLSKY